MLLYSMLIIIIIIIITYNKLTACKLSACTCKLCHVYMVFTIAQRSGNIKGLLLVMKPREEGSGEHEAVYF